MAYFSNGTEGGVFDSQCGKCKYGQKACPIAWVQGYYNYDAVNNQVATDILNTLVTNDGTCMMFNTFKEDFEVDGKQLEMELP